jgi:hypothetical protein
MIPVNPPMLSFGIDRLYIAMTQFCDAYPSLPLVSVGCGPAVVERELRTRVKNDFFLVDPAPHSYYPEMKTHFHQFIVAHGMPATHSYTSELILSNPEIAIGDHCLLLLHWCDYGTNDYDLEAVRLLRPKAIFVVFDTTGSAASAQFHAFLAQPDKEYSDKCVYTICHTRHEQYACSHETIEMRWLERTREQEETQKYAFECHQQHDNANIQNRQVLYVRALEKSGLPFLCNK